LKSLLLNAKSSLKVVRGEKELSEKDIDEIPKGLMPGEWILILDKLSQKNFIAYINPFSENYFKIKIVFDDLEKRFNSKSNEEEVAIEILKLNLQRAFNKRDDFLDYKDGARLVYGINDSLPGLIVDKYEKYIFVQINTAGIDRFRNLIKAEICEKYKNQKVMFYDNVEYRKAEVLPTYDAEKMDSDLEVLENGIKYNIPQKVMQKIGYYYDHRENRNKILNLLNRLNFNKKNGLDLFSYVGSWGLHLLKANVENVDFVDQGNMQEAIQNNLTLNNFINRGEFIRSDVFKFLDNSVAKEKRYDIIVSDPPAFTKSEKNKDQALQGYEKLHLKVMRLLSNKAILVIASCTHYVSYEELDKTIQDSALKNSQKVQLLDMGLQGFDHPFTGFKDKGFYIKYLVYSVIRG
jgi:23S rRNA (cytosine1962-C5)-methyltransferase